MFNKLWYLFFLMKNPCQDCMYKKSNDKTVCDNCELGSEYAPREDKEHGKKRKRLQ